MPSAASRLASSCCSAHFDVCTMIRYGCGHANYKQRRQSGAAVARYREPIRITASMGLARSRRMHCLSRICCDLACPPQTDLEGGGVRGRLYCKVQSEKFKLQIACWGACSPVGWRWALDFGRGLGYVLGALSRERRGKVRIFRKGTSFFEGDRFFEGWGLKCKSLGVGGRVGGAKPRALCGGWGLRYWGC